MPLPAKEHLPHKTLSQPYCNTTQQQLGRLQCIQNAAARLITSTPRQEHISPVLMQLHWLKVPQRITFKIIMFTNIPGNSRQSSHLHIVLGPDQNLVPFGVTKLYCDFQLDTYMRGLKMFDGLFRKVA